MDVFELIAKAVVDGKAALVKTLAEEALHNDIPAEEILNKGLIVGMNTVSERFRNEEFYIPDVLTSSRAVHAGMRVVRPILVEAAVPVPGKIVIGTVAGDLHDIGKNLVVMFLRARGYEVIDLGIDIHPEEFVEAVISHQPHILGMSALLTTTMPMMGTTVKLLERSSLRDKVKIIIGGGPVTRDYSATIGADGYAADAKSTVELVNNCLKDLVAV